MPLELACFGSLDQLREVPAIKGTRECPVSMPRKDMQRASDLHALSIRVLELMSVVQARVPARLDGFWRVLPYKERLASNLVHHVVADVRLSLIHI